MKKKFKILGLTLSACMAFGLAALASGCSAKDKTDKWFEQLFCEHKYDEGVETQAPTCTEEGVLTYTCTECGKTKKKDIAMIEHTEVEIPSVSPTCTEVGYAGGICCEVCELVIVEQTELVALGHLEIPDKAVAATCTTSGKTAGKHCKRCNEVLEAQEKVPATGHTEVTDAAVAATCTTSGKTAGKHCSVCNTVITAQERIPATGHMDSNGDLSCDVCGIVPLNEVKPTVGECVAGNTYRIYPGTNYSGEDVYNLQPELQISVTLTDGSTKTLFVTVCGETFSGFNISGFVFEHTLGDGYRDVMFKVGTYTALDANGNELTFRIDETSVITMYLPEVGTSHGTVRRLESTSIANEES